MTYCHNPNCRFNQFLYNGYNVCGLPRNPALRQVSDDMRPEIMVCCDFKEGKNNDKDVRDREGYYPGQMKEPR